MARQLDTVSFVWAAAATGSTIIAASEIPGISRATIIPPAAISITGSIELEVASSSGSFAPVGQTIIPGTASLIDPWPQGIEYRLTADGPNAEAAANFDVLGQVDGVSAAPDVGLGKSPGGIPLLTFADLGSGSLWGLA